MTIFVTSDDAVFVGGALHKVLLTLGEATLIVVGVIFLFLRSWRATIIPAVTVPIALIGTLAAIYIAGFSLNILTLLAIVLATGLVVDDAIVVLENIERHRAQGMGPRAAAVLGARQVFFAVVGDDGDACRRLHPDLLLPRHRRAALRRIRLRDGLRGRPLHAGGAHALPDDGLAHPEGA